MKGALQARPRTSGEKSEIIGRLGISPRKQPSQANAMVGCVLSI